MGGRVYDYSRRPLSPVWKCLEIPLRIAAALLSLGSLIIMAKNKQVVHLRVYQVFVTIAAKPGYSKAFIFLIYANGIVAVYSAVVAFFLLITCCKANRGKFFSGVNFLMDQAVTYTLLAAAAASTEFSYLAKRGDSKVNWSEVCSQFNRFCNIVGVSLLLAFLSILTMGLVSILSARRFFKSHAPVPEKAVANDVPAA